MKKKLQDSFKSSNYANFKFVKNLKRQHKTYDPSKVGRAKTIGNSKLVEAPKRITIYDADKPSKQAFLNTLDFRDELIKNIGQRNCIIDFSQTEYITVAAMLLIFSEIQTLIRIDKAKTSIRWSQNSTSVNRMLKRTGLKKLLLTGDSIHNFNDLKSLPIINGVGSQHYDDIVDFIIRRYTDNGLSPDTEYLISDAVSETINNVGRHAYPEDEQENKPWWLMCDIIGNQLFLAIYDRGVGIPKTVVEKKWFLSSLKKTYPELHKEYSEVFGDKGNLFEFFTVKKFKDAELIYLSMLGDVSGTKEKKHGQGSKSFKALVNETDGGKLWVYSNNGLYKFENEEETPQVYKLAKNICGTLNQWNISLT